MNAGPAETAAADSTVAAALNADVRAIAATGAISGMENPLKGAMYSASGKMENRRQKPLR
jgi:formylmethanofuran:tetrahydromethanopterin formyltransferase